MSTSNQTDQIDEGQGIYIMDHIAIRDVDSAEELVNQRGSMINIPTYDDAE